MGFCSIFRRPPRKPRESARLSTGVVNLELDKQEAENVIEDHWVRSETPESRSADPSTSRPVAQSLPGKLWNNAYDRLKAHCLNLVEDYEIVLSTRLTKQDGKDTDVDHQRLIWCEDMSKAPYLSNEVIVCTFLQRYYRQWMHDVELLGERDTVAFTMHMNEGYLKQRRDFKFSFKFTAKAFGLARGEWIDTMRRSSEERERDWAAMHGMEDEDVDSA